MRSGAKKVPNVVAVDFFCGAGGVTLGLRKAGIRVIAGIDIEEDFEKTYTQNNRQSSFVRKDISTVSRDDIAQLLDGIDYDYLLFAGCAPCQPFSFHYKGDTSGDERETALSHFGRLIHDTKPDFVFSENVPGILKKQDGKIIEDFILALEEQGYQTVHEVVNAKWYGVPQDRRRLLLLASRIGSGICIPLKTHGPDLRRYSTVKDTIHGYPRLKHGQKCRSMPNHESAGLTAKNLGRMKKTPRNGGGWKDWPSALRLACHKKDGAGHSDVYGRMRWDDPAPTITCRCYSISNGRFGHPSQNRAVSFREAAALQTFPDNYVFRGKSQRSLGMQIGNAVPVNLAKLIGKEVMRVAGGSESADSPRHT